MFEYRPAMMHCKMLIADGDWSVIGTTNMDNRSFEHNDEVNMVMLDRDMTTPAAARTSSATSPSAKR